MSSIIFNGTLDPFVFYSPGTIFGILMIIALRKHKTGFLSIILIVTFTIEFLSMIMFCSKDFPYLELRRLLMGGVGALLFIGTVGIIYEVPFKVLDYFIAFVLGIGTTFYMWTDDFGWFDTSLIITAVLLWQIAMAFIVERRIRKAVWK